MLHSPKPNKFSPTFCCGICWCFSPPFFFLLQKNCKAIFLNSLSRHFLLPGKKEEEKEVWMKLKLLVDIFFSTLVWQLTKYLLWKPSAFFVWTYSPCSFRRNSFIGRFFQFSVTDKFLAFTFYWHLNVSPGWTLRLNKQTFGSRTSHTKQQWHSSTSSQNKW